jgi:hypothetical protein
MGTSYPNFAADWIRTRRLWLWSHPGERESAAVFPRFTAVHSDSLPGWGYFRESTAPDGFSDQSGNPTHIY